MRNGSRSRLVWRRGARELRLAIVDLLLPPRCAGCGEAIAQPSLCGPCAAHLRRRAGGCSRCGEPLLPGQACASDHRWLAGLDWLRAPFAYAGTGGALVRRLKLHGDFAALPVLAAAMAAALRPALGAQFRHALLVPVPLHRRRRRLRGFDQARLLAHAIGRRCGLAVESSCLLRVAATLPQGDPRVTSRERNLAGAFGVRRARRLRGRPVVLVDDVATSGATARACARELAAAGVRDVGLLAACRA